MKRYFYNFNWLLLEKIIRTIGGLFVGVWVARYLGPHDFGILNYALAYTALFMLFVKLGLDQIVVRELVKFPEQTGKLLGTAFGLKLTGSFIAIISIFCSLYFIQTTNLTKTIIIIISLQFISQSLDVIDFFFQSQIVSKNVVIARSIGFLISSIFKIYFIINKYSVVYFAIAICIDFFIAGFFLLIIYTKTGNLVVQWKFCTQTAKRYLKFCWPLAISTFLITVHLKIDQVMIGNMLDSEQVGIYSVAVTLSESWYFIPAIIVSTLMPYFVDLRENNNDLYYLKLTQLYSLMFWMGVVVGVVVLFFGETLVRIAFGDNYIEAYEALTFNIWAGIFVAQSYAKGIWVISENLQFYRIIGNIVAVAINVVGNYLFIPQYGIGGAAMVTLFTRFVNNWVTPLFIKPYRENTILSIKSINFITLYKRRGNYKQ